MKNGAVVRSHTGIHEAVYYSVKPLRPTSEVLENDEDGKLKEPMRLALPPQNPRHIAEINVAAEEMQSLLCEVIEQKVPWAKPSDWANPFWIKGCNEAMEEASRRRISESNPRVEDCD